MTINYLDLEYIKQNVIPTVQKYYARPNNPAHNYSLEPKAIEQLKGCLERIRWDYVPNLIAKAAQLFICINKGHYFENGNKRLALVTLLSFLLENKYNFKDHLEKAEFADMLGELFPQFENFEDEKDFTSIEFAYYNLTIIVAESGRLGINHDDLKRKVEIFLDYSNFSPEEIENAGDMYLQNLENN